MLEDAFCANDRRVAERLHKCKPCDMRLQSAMASGQEHLYAAGRKAFPRSIYLPSHYGSKSHIAKLATALPSGRTSHTWLCRYTYCSRFVFFSYPRSFVFDLWLVIVPSRRPDFHVDVLVHDINEINRSVCCGEPDEQWKARPGDLR